MKRRAPFASRGQLTARGPRGVAEKSRRHSLFASPSLRTAGLLLLGVGCLSLSFAPIKQFYFAWIGLTPFLLAARSQRSPRAAFLWGWAAGTLFFLINMAWLEHVTLAGTIALAIYLGLFWGLAAMLIRGCALLGKYDAASAQTRPPKRPIRCALLLAAMWCGLEWLRGSYSPFGAHGLPWLYLGYSQSPVLVTCQIADLAGVYGVSFWVVLINAIAAMAWIDRGDLRRLRPAFASLAGLLIALLGYGSYRLSQHTTRPGPTVLVVQSNFPQSNTGEKGASIEDIVNFHMHTTESALLACERRGQQVDLVVWSETMMPPLNQQTRTFCRGMPLGDFIEQTSQQISDLADRFRTSFLVGATYQADWRWVAGTDRPQAEDRRNSAYLYGPTGLLSDQRYDKIQLLPFGEFVPYRDTLPWLYHILVSLGPPDLKDYELTAGAPDALTVFKLEQTQTPPAGTGQPVIATEAWRFVVPICFEDIVPPLVDALMWGADGKRADFIVNVTNDGWFLGAERSQQLQAALFRSIEHRVPQALSVNTGISGFVDSAGRVSDCVAAETQGWSVEQLQIDDRGTLYSRLGDTFAKLCAVVMMGIVGYGIATAVKSRWLLSARSPERISP